VIIGTPNPDYRYTKPITCYPFTFTGVTALVNAIPDIGALAKLDISNNHIEQGEPLQLITELCNTKGIEFDNSNSDY
jgi:hypothetical protein